MQDLNNVILEGHLSKDARQHNDSVYFTIGVNRSYKDSKQPSGYATVTSWTPVRINGKLGNAVFDRLKKGNKVSLVGQLNTYNGQEVQAVKSGQKFAQPMFLIDVEKINITEKNGSPSQEDEPPM